MLKIVAIAVLAASLTACVNQPRRPLAQASWSTMSLAEAQAKCEFTASQIAAQPQNQGILMPIAAYNHAMGQCLRANGWQ